MSRGLDRLRAGYTVCSRYRVYPLKDPGFVSWVLSYRGQRRFDRMIRLFDEAGLVSSVRGMSA